MHIRTHAIGMAICASIIALRLSTLCPAAQAAPAPDDDLHLDVNLGLWGTSISGTTGFRRLETDVDVSFDEIIRHANFAAMGGFELSRNNWILDFNGVYCHLGDSATGVGGRDVNVSASTGIGDLALGYTLVQTKVGSMPLALTPAIGARYINISESLKINNLPSGSSCVVVPTYPRSPISSWELE